MQLRCRKGRNLSSVLSSLILQGSRCSEARDQTHEVFHGSVGASGKTHFMWALEAPEELRAARSTSLPNPSSCEYRCHSEEMGNLLLLIARAWWEVEPCQTWVCAAWQGIHGAKKKGNVQDFPGDAGRAIQQQGSLREAAGCREILQHLLDVQKGQISIWKDALAAPVFSKVSPGSNPSHIWRFPGLPQAPQGL